MLIVLIVVLIFSYLGFQVYFKPFWYWKTKNVPHLKPMPVVGNLGSWVFQRKPFAHCINDIYTSYPEKRYVGFHKLLQPALLIRDPELIKALTVKDWVSFSHHGTVVSKEVDPLWGYSVIAMEGDEEWRQLRSILSFSFTSSKLKNMFNLIKHSTREFNAYVEKQKGNVITIDIREALLKYTNDVIATTAFGVACNSFEQPQNEFYLMGKDASNFEGLQAVKFFIGGISPFFMKTLGIMIYSQRVRTFFYKVIRDTLRYRKKFNVIRPDMVQLMMEAKENGIMDAQDELTILPEANGINKKKLVINDDVITAQSISFFIGGFDSTATVMSFTTYELACNLDIQGILRLEVDSSYEACNGDITFEALMGMKYLDMVVSEALRKWPSILVTDRAVVQKYTIEPADEEESALTIDTDVVCAIPIYSIHMDPKYYDNPDKFDPQRFSEENKQSIKPYTYLPFGSGPRGCIGSRFALLEIKLIIAQIIHKFEILPTTDVPIKFSTRGFLLRPNSGVLLNLKRRNGKY